MTIDYSPLPPLPRDCLKKIEDAVIADLKPVRPLASPGRYLAIFIGIFAAACLIGWYGIGGYGWHALSELQKGAVFAPMAAVTVLLAFSIVQQMSPASRYQRSAALVAMGIFIILLLLMMGVFPPRQESDFVKHGLACLRTGMAFAIPSAFLFTLLLRRGAGLSPLLTGATAGGLAGLAGLGVLEIHCPNLNVYHIVVWHVSVTLLCVVAGLIFSSVTFQRRTPNH